MVVDCVFDSLDEILTPDVTTNIRVSLMQLPGGLIDQLAVPAPFMAMAGTTIVFLSFLCKYARHYLL
jgi:hypothetical protein